MPSAARTITINRPPDQVFAFFTNPANDPKWRKGVKEISAEGAMAVGTKVHQAVAGPGGRSIAADIQVTTWEPPTRYGFRAIAGPARPVGEYVFTASTGGTDVRFTLSAELGGLKGLFMSRPVQSTMDAEMQALDTAKSLLEAG